jgi:glycosyltransferase involved in cell wall biosynthesis
MAFQRSAVTYRIPFPEPFAEYFGDTSPWESIMPSTLSPITEQNIRPARRDDLFTCEPTSEAKRNNDIERPREGTPKPKTASFVIPVKNERDSLRELRDRINANTPVGFAVEIIFIEDGSTDDSWKVIRGLVESKEATVRGLRFRGNRGKAAALTAGFRAATGDVVFTMDADLQDDPAEIPAMLAKLDEGYDIVSGWKRVRHDPWHKVLPSRVFNWMLSRVCGVKLHDHNCGFKCYRAEVTRRLALHGEMHRMIPSLASILGFRSAELPVRYHARRHGVSKYGFERYLRGFFDMVTVGFLRRFGERPSHLMGKIAVAHLGAGLLLLAIGLWLGLASPAGQTLAIIGAVLAAATFPLLACGLLSELVIRGGMPATWKLPIVEDTAFSDAAPDAAAEIRRPIPLAYTKNS